MHLTYTYLILSEFEATFRIPPLPPSITISESIDEINTGSPTLLYSGQLGMFAPRLVDLSAGWFVIWLVGWLVCWLVGRLVDCLVRWMVAWLIGLLASEQL